jgi:hypothetical protein
MGPTATPALLPGLFALVRVREEGQRGGGRITITIDDGYGRVSRRRVTIWNKGGNIDVRLVRFGRGQVSDEWGHATYSVHRRGRSGEGTGCGLSLGRFRESEGMECCAVRSGHLRRSPLLWAFAGGGIGALVACGEGTVVWGHDDRSAVVDGGGVGEVGLAEAGSWGEMNTRTQDRGGQGKGERAIRGRRRVRVCLMLETWAQGCPRHSKAGRGGAEGG